MKSYELIVETLNKQNIKKQIVIPEDFTEKKIWRLVMKEFVTYGKKHGYNPMGEVITHIMTGKYKSKTLTKDDKLMLGILEKDILSKTKTQENIIRALSARRAMDEFWEQKEEEGGGLRCRFHTEMCRWHFGELIGLCCGNIYSDYKEVLEEFIPSCKNWPERNFFYFENIVKETKKRYGFVLDEEMELEEVLYTFDCLPSMWYEFVDYRSEEDKIKPEIIYKLFNEGLKFKYVEWFIWYCKDIKKSEEDPEFPYAHYFSYNGLINSWLYDAVYKAFSNGEFDTLKNYGELKKAIFDVNMKGTKKA